jgi:hypothetical protein
MTRRDGWDGNKRKYIRIDSGVPHNPDPTTPRGWRRREKKQEAKKK